MNEAEVRAFLGTPDDVGRTSNKHGRSSILKYGDLEFSFHDDSLGLIHTDDFEVPSGGKSIQLDPWLLTNELTLQEASTELTNHGVRVEPLQGPLGDCLLCGVGVKLIFSDQGYLCALSYSDPGF